MTAEEWVMARRREAVLAGRQPAEYVVSDETYSRLEAHAESCIERGTDLNLGPASADSPLVFRGTPVVKESSLGQ